MSCVKGYKGVCTGLSSPSGVPINGSPAELTQQPFAHTWLVDDMVCDSEKKRGKAFSSVDVHTNPLGEQHIYGHTKQNGGTTVVIAYLGKRELNIGHVDRTISELDKRDMITGDGESTQVIWESCQYMNQPSAFVGQVVKKSGAEDAGYDDTVMPITRKLFMESSDGGVEQAAFVMTGKATALLASQPEGDFQEYREACNAVNAYARGESDETNTEVLARMVEATNRHLSNINPQTDTEKQQVSELASVQQRALEILSENGHLWVPHNGREITVDAFVHDMRGDS